VPVEEPSTASIADVSWSAPLEPDRQRQVN
jgi:hypothetical protein